MIMLLASQAEHGNKVREIDDIIDHIKGSLDYVEAQFERLEKLMEEVSHA